jgi:hypothetical protein
MPKISQLPTQVAQLQLRRQVAVVALQLANLLQWR